MKNKKAFTLVELIVVITILAILWTIAFISFQNYSKNSRDWVRVADINSIKKTLELFITEKWFYPMPDNGTQITYSWATAWVQWTVWDNVIINLWRINKKPTDPLTNNEYTYSVTNSKTEYQLSYVTEEWLAYNVPLTNQANAATTKKALAKVTGTYNEKILKVATWTTTYILAVPTIINANLNDTNLQSIIDNKELVYNNYSNLPDSYKNLWYTMTWWFEFSPISNNIVVYSWTIDSSIKTETEKLIFLNNLKTIYKDTILNQEPIYTEIINSDTVINPAQAITLVDTYITNNVWWITGVPSVITYWCAPQPSYTDAIFTAWTPTLVNQTWQNTTNTNPCYWTCWTWKVLVWEQCVQETCAWTTPDWTTKISNATSAAWWIWHYSTTPWVCTYNCNTTYHTEDSGTTCVSDTRTCTILNWIWQQTRNWSSRLTCTPISCDPNYSSNGTTCELNTCVTQPIYTNATYTVWTPTQVNQPRQNSTNTNPCYYTCINWYTWSDCSVPTFLTNCTWSSQFIYTDATWIEIWRVNNAWTTISWNPLTLTCAWHIIVCTGNNTWYVLQACNLWSSTVWATNTFASYGNRYQWWRNKWFTWTVTQQATQIPNASYNPLNDTYWFVWNSNLSSYRIDWIVTQDDNLWGNTTNTSIARQWPCSIGYHVPSQPEWVAIHAIWWWGTTLWTALSNTLKLPFAGRRVRDNGTMTGQGAFGGYWSSSPYESGTYGYYLYFFSTSLWPIDLHYRATGFSVRCIKN
jgi:prepilin-type N-terminal cleavage/methylation domain-containing protein